MSIILSYCSRFQLFKPLLLAILIPEKLIKCLSKHFANGNTRRNGGGAVATFNIPSIKIAHFPKREECDIKNYADIMKQKLGAAIEERVVNREKYVRNPKTDFTRNRAITMKDTIT